jgi:hypothetical protein
MAVVLTAAFLYPRVRSRPRRKLIQRALPPHQRARGNRFPPNRRVPALPQAMQPLLRPSNVLRARFQHRLLRRSPYRRPVQVNNCRPLTWSRLDLPHPPRSPPPRHRAQCPARRFRPGHLHRVPIKHLLLLPARPSPRVRQARVPWLANRKRVRSFLHVPIWFSA